MKIKQGIAVAAAALLTLTACSGGTDTAAPAADEKTKVLFISFTNDITEMAGQILEGMKIEFENAGFAVDVQTAAPSGAEDNEGFDRLLQDAITINPDFLLVLPASYDLVEDRLVAIQEAGIKTVVVNYFPGMIEKTPRIDPLTWITVNEKLMGEVGGKYMAEQYCAEGKSPNVVPFYGPIASEISIQRMGGALGIMDEILKACGQKLVVLEEIYSEFNREKAFTFAENIATKYPVGKLDLIIGANSNTALGVMEALTGQKRLADVDILGMGGQLDELAAICRGDIKAAGYRNSLLMGSTIANAVMDTTAGRAVEKITLPPIPLVNNCETVFKEMPELFREFEGFRRNISDEMFNQYAK